MFAGTIPRQISQDYDKGNNDLYAAKITRFAYSIESKLMSDGYDIDWIIDFETLIQEQVGAWTEKSKLLNVQVFTYDTWTRHFVADALADVVLLAIAVVLVSLYSYTVLGSFNPILFRACTAFVGILCVMISITSGYALAFGLGNKISNFHNIIPFLIVGVGVDDMFVIVNSIDSVPIDMHPNERFI